jgi:drug/metabolite transporter (DMT)-like permease
MNIKIPNSILFAIPTLIWGSTWYAIKFQLGNVDPIMSVSYRFFMAGSILLLFCLIFKYNMRYSLNVHMLFLLQGVLLFGINYWLVYLAEEHVTSGLIAVVFSLVVFFNAIFGALFIRSKITWKIMVGGILAISGTALIFLREVKMLFGTGIVLSAILLSLGSLVLASLGNVLSAYNQKNKIPVLQANAFSMMYGSIIVFLLGMIIGTRISFETRYSYLFSLSYLAIFGSIVAFTSYLKIIGRVGPARGSYALVLVPIVAMIFSTFFESYHWQYSALLGLPVLILGNLVAMDRLKPEKLVKRWKS